MSYYSPFLQIKGKSIKSKYWVQSSGLNEPVWWLTRVTLVNYKHAHLGLGFRAQSCVSRSKAIGKKEYYTVWDHIAVSPFQSWPPGQFVRTTSLFTLLFTGAHFSTHFIEKCFLSNLGKQLETIQVNFEKSNNAWLFMIGNNITTPSLQFWAFPF